MPTLPSMLRVVAISCCMAGLLPRQGSAESRSGPSRPLFLRGIVDARFSLVTYEGGSTADLGACAEHVRMRSLYVRDEDAWVSLILGAPDFVNRDFRERYAEVIPADTPMIAQRAGPDDDGP